jgi:1,4-alpha-glucan branching enzyme
VTGHRAPSLSLVLHAHAPLAVGEPGRPHERLFLELCEHGLLPLLEWAEEEEPGDSALTLAVSPPLLANLAELELRSRLDAHLEERVALAHSEVSRLEAAGVGYFHRVAAWYRDRALARLEQLRHELDGDLLGALRRLRAAGKLALLPSGATHAVLPLVQPEALRALHVKAACADFEHHFDARPEAFWLPECAWAPGLDRALAAEGVRRTVVAANAVRPMVGPPDRQGLPPLRTPAGVVAFPEASELRTLLLGPGGMSHDLAFARPLDEGVQNTLPLYAHGDDGERAPLDPSAADRRARALGCQLVGALGEHAERRGTPPPHVLALELTAVGPGWPEGLAVLKSFVAAAREAEVRVGPLGAGVDDGEDFVRAEPLASSWREDGYFGAWVSEETAWLFRRLARLAEQWQQCRDPVRGRARNARAALVQAQRELLFAQASDWPAAIARGSRVRAAVAHFHDHAESAERLLAMVASGQVDEAYLERRRKRLPVFDSLEPA